MFEHGGFGCVGRSNEHGDPVFVSALIPTVVHVLRILRDIVFVQGNDFHCAIEPRAGDVVAASVLCLSKSHVMVLVH